MLSLNLGNFKTLDNQIEFKRSNFPGGECFFRSRELVPYEYNENIHIYTRLNSSNDIIELLMATDALRRMGAKKLFCTIPYIPYGRQDRSCNPGEAFSLKVFANLINQLQFERVYTFDAHSHVSEGHINGLADYTNRGFIQIAAPILGRNLNFICPDEGASKKIKQTLSGFINPRIYFCSKERDSKTTEIIKVVVPKIDNDNPCLIIDDICDGGNSFIKLAEEFKKINTNQLNLAVTHGIFSKGIDVLKPYFNKVFTTNSINDNYTGNDFVYQFSIFY